MGAASSGQRPIKAVVAGEQKRDVRVLRLFPRLVNLDAFYKQNSVKPFWQYWASFDSTIWSAYFCTEEVAATPKPKPITDAETKRRMKVRIA